MITVSNDYKTAARADIKEVIAKVVLIEDSTTITDNDDLVSITLSADSGLLKSVLRQVDIVVNGSYDWLDKIVEVYIGVVTTGGNEYINYGKFKIVKATTNESNAEITFKAYDLMYEANLEYDLEPIYDITYPITVLNFIDAICTRLSWTNGVVSIPNGTLELSEDLFLEQQLSFRNVLDMIAEATGSILYFQGNTLKARQVDTSTSVQTIDSGDMLNLAIETKYGEINSVVLSRTPQEDNIAQEDSTSVATNGRTEVKIENNLIVDADRPTWITEIFNNLFEIEYYPFKTSVEGINWLEVGDVLTLTNPDSSTKVGLLTKYTIIASSGLSVILEGKRPTLGVTNYDYAGVIGRRIKTTEIIVDKQQGQIDLLVTEIATAGFPRQAEPPSTPSVNDLYLDTDDNIIYIWDGAVWQPTSISPDTLDGYYTKDETESKISISGTEILSSVSEVQETANAALTNSNLNADEIATIQGQITTIQQEADAINIAVAGQGGVNLIKNSAGLKGTLEEWQEFDEAGDLLDVDNNGTITQTTDVQNNSESGSGISLSEQFILQNLPTLVGNVYTLFFRYKKTDDATVQITGQTDVVLDGTNDVWATFKEQFTATSINTTVRITNVGVTGGVIIVSDVVCKIGDANAWTQAPNESYGINFRLDKDGLKITKSSSGYQNTIDDDSMTIENTSSGKVITQITKDEAKMTNATIQDNLVVQRYDNPSAALRVIPVDDGVIEVIND